MILVAVMGMMTLSESCRKPNLIGDDLLPEEDLLNSSRIDTFQIITYTDYEDSVVTSQNLFYALGSLNSDIYGKSTAGIYAQIKLPTNNLNFGEGASIDSIVLTMDYSAFYGDAEAEHRISVYRLTEHMQSGRLYYSDTRFHILPVALGKKTFVPNLTDSVELNNGVKQEPHLRIKLYDSFGRNIINLDTLVLENDTSFLSYLPGFYIEPDTSAGYSNGMMYFDMLSTLSGVTVYYRNTEADSLSVRFPFSGVKTNRFTHTYPADAEVTPHLTTPNTTIGDPVTYVQGLGGLRTIVKIPTIENLQDVSINKAELTVYVAGGTTSQFPSPPKLLLTQLDSSGHNFYYLQLYSYEVYSSIVDDVLGSNDIGGVPTQVTDRYGTPALVCKYNITRHVQEIIEGSITNNGFSLTCFPGNRIANSLTLAGSDCLRFTNRPYLTITYTTINK